MLLESLSIRALSSVIVGIAAIFLARYALMYAFDLRGPPADATRLLAFSLVLALALACVLYTGFYHEWMFWEASRKDSRLVVVVKTALALFLLVEAFTALTFVLVNKNVIALNDASPWIPYGTGSSDGPSPSGFGGSSSTWHFNWDAYAWIESYYIWHFLDAIPALKIPATLNWEDSKLLPDRLSGGILPMFKILVILPVIRLIVQSFSKPKRPTEASRS